MWDLGKYPNSQDKKIEVSNYGHAQHLVPHTKHIEALKKHHEDGHIVVVWSAAGALWAKNVVIALGLENHVHLTMSKPNLYYDDLIPNDFMPISNRIYFEHIDD